MSRPVRYGIVGAGVGAMFAARALKALEEEGEARLAAVCSRREERAREFARRWGAEGWFTNPLEMYARAGIDAVVISTPHYLHFPIAVDAMESGVHVLVDKPMAVSLRECDEMISRARRMGVKLGVLLQYRFDENVGRVKKLVEGGELGRLILGEARVKWFRPQEYYSGSDWRGRWATEGGGALINQAIHFIDLLLYIMGEPLCLYAQAGTFTHEIEVEDLAAAVLRFKNGALGVVVAGTSLYPGLPTSLEIHGENGTAIIEGEALKMVAVKGREPFSAEEKRGLAAWASPEAVPPHNHIALIRDFTRAIIEDREPLVNGLEGRRSIEVIRAIYASWRQARPVNLPLQEF